MFIVPTSSTFTSFLGVFPPLILMIVLLLTEQGIPFYCGWHVTFQNRSKLRSFFTFQMLSAQQKPTRKKSHYYCESWPCSVDQAGWDCKYVLALVIVFSKQIHSFNGRRSFHFSLFEYYRMVDIWVLVVGDIKWLRTKTRERLSQYSADSNLFRRILNYIEVIIIYFICLKYVSNIE